MLSRRQAGAGPGVVGAEELAGQAVHQEAPVGVEILRHHQDAGLRARGLEADVAPRGIVVQALDPVAGPIPSGGAGAG